MFLELDDLFGYIVLFMGLIDFIVAVRAV